MALCIPKDIARTLKQAIENGEISVDLLKQMSSTERANVFKKYLGEELGKKMNVGFEQRLTSKAKDILKNYIERELTRIPQTSRKVLLNRLQKMENLLNPAEGQPFLDELVAHKLGIRVTADEAKTLMNLADEARKAKEAIPPEVIEKGLRGTDAQMKYGYAEVALVDYMSDVQRLRGNRNWADIKEQKTLAKKWEQFARHTYNTMMDGVGALKGIVASFDNSFFGRQGIRVLFNKPDIWAKNFTKSWSDLGETLKTAGFKPVSGNDGVRLWGERNATAYDRMRAEILSRPNALNGTYDRASNGFGLRLGTEEQYPVNMGEKLPVFGRLYKASEVAFNGAALRMRADLADAMIANFKHQGLDITDKELMDELGRFVSSMTGRGDLGRFETAAGELGSIMFSMRFLKSQLDTFNALPKYVMQPSNPVRKAAARATMQTLFGWAGLLGTAHMLGIADLDPRSDKFGTIRIGSYAFDITGGHASMIRLVAKLITGERYDPRTGTFRSVESFGTSRDDLVWDYFTGKLAPVPAMIRDMLRGEHFGGEEISSTSIARNLLVPISIENGFDVFSKKDFSEAFLVVLAEGLGFSPTDFRYNPTGKGWKELKNTDKKLYNQATGELWNKIYPEIQKARNSSYYQKLDKEEQTKFMERLESRIKEQVINQSKYRKAIESKQLDQ